MVNGKFHKLEAIENQLKEVYDKNKEQIKRPVTAFVTFCNQEAKERCVKYFGTKKDSLKTVIYKEEKLMLFDEPMPAYAAAEATNIIWENLAYEDRDILRRRLSV